MSSSAFSSCGTFRPLIKSDPGLPPTKSPLVVLARLELATPVEERLPPAAGWFWRRRRLQRFE